jgi:hypothetical protein
VATTARQTAESQMASGKDRAAEGLGSVAQALRQTGEQMRPQDHLGVSPYLSAVAEQIDRASGYLQDRSLGQLVGDVESFARREPAIFLGGAFLAGLLAGRFLKSSGDTARPAAIRGYLPAYMPDNHDAAHARVDRPLGAPAAPPPRAPMSAGPHHAPPAPPPRAAAPAASLPAPAASLPAPPAVQAALPASPRQPPQGSGGSGGSGSA